MRHLKAASGITADIQSAAPVFTALSIGFRGSVARLRPLQQMAHINDASTSAAVRVGREERAQALQEDLIGYEIHAAAAREQAVLWDGAKPVVDVAARDWARAEAFLEAEGMMARDASGEVTGFDNARIDSEAAALGGELEESGAVLAQTNPAEPVAGVTTAFIDMQRAAAHIRMADLLLVAREREAYADDRMAEHDAIVRVREAAACITDELADAASTTSNGPIANAGLVAKKVIDVAVTLITAESVDFLEREIDNAYGVAAALRGAAELQLIGDAARRAHTSSVALQSALGAGRSHAAERTAQLINLGNGADQRNRAAGKLDEPREQHAASGAHLGLLLQANESALSQQQVLSSMGSQSEEFAKSVYQFIRQPRTDGLLVSEASAHIPSADAAWARRRAAELGMREAVAHRLQLAPALASLQAHLDKATVPQ